MTSCSMKSGYLGSPSLKDLRKKRLHNQGLVDGLQAVAPQNLEELDLVILPKQAVDLLQNDELLQQVGWPHSQSRCG